MLAAIPGDDRVRRLVRRMYAQSGIAFRHSVLGDLAGDVAEPFFTHGSDGTWHTPSTAVRNARFTQAAPALFIGAARAALARSGFTADQVTHVVTASCTGCFNPGPDFHVVRALGLPDRTHRVHVGFMGCYAMFPALKVAEAFCRADPRAVVLVACVELCTLHVQLKPSQDALLGGCLFGDGGGAAVLSAQPPRRGHTTLRILELGGCLLPDSAGAMAWTIGDDGFDIVLSSYVPDLIQAHIRPTIEGWLMETALHLPEVARWAVHPGGRAILDKTATALALPPEALQASYNVLHDIGNLSSATLFFVLERMLQATSGTDGEPICALAFGPGLSVEMGLFQPEHNAVKTMDAAPGAAMIPA